MRKAWLLCGALLLLLARLPAADEVIYPRSPAATSDKTLPVQANGINPSLLVLALVAAGAGGWLLWRQRRSGPGLSAGEARKLAVLETRSLGNRQYLVVAGYDGRKFLLGVCPGRIDLLSPLDGGTLPARRE